MTGPGRPRKYPVGTTAYQAKKLREAARKKQSRKIEQATTVKEKALAKQEGGNHYKDCKIQPIEYIHANGLGFAEGSVVKYITRWKSKNGIEDLKKAIHFIELLIELEQKK